MAFLLNPNFWKAIPVIVQFMLELKKLLDAKVAEDKRHEKLKEIKAAVARARISGNTDDLDRVISSFKSP